MSYEDSDNLIERYELTYGRIARIGDEELSDANFSDYFHKTAELFLMAEDTYKFVKSGVADTASMEELQNRNHRLYSDILPENYDKSFCNPAYATKKLGRELGGLLCEMAANSRYVIYAAHEQDLLMLVIYAELFCEIYTLFAYSDIEENRLPEYSELREIIYSFNTDYAEEIFAKAQGNMVNPEFTFFTDIVKNADLCDLRYLYRYGFYVSDNELKIADYINKLPEETIALMADTYTEGYRIGFEKEGVDLRNKGVAGVEYPIGFERMIRRAINNLENLNQKISIYRANQYAIEPRGAYSTNPNRQYSYDHREGNGYLLDKNYVNRAVEGLKSAFETVKDAAGKYAGPAVVQTFGHENFDPVNKPECCKYTDEQNKLHVELEMKIFEVMKTYIDYEERSFTIISFPVPEIGGDFDAIFEGVVKLNTLDYKKYEKIQQTIIDALDKADRCHIVGAGNNKTDLWVELYKLTDPTGQTIFENCVADVNIPVGEVFTSPVLEGTNGTLYVSRVFLNGLEYRNLEITFKEGKIDTYTCTNFKDEKANKDFLDETVLFKHKTLPIGEFAIGTNTTAYVFGRKYGIEDRLPILIAEKTGPHFAVGDTCYSNSEEVAEYNPDGKQIVARENSVSALRKEDPLKAYFNCHTDITIPYDELGRIDAVCGDGEIITIIEDGRFVLPGTEELNAAFDEK